MNHPHASRWTRQLRGRSAKRHQLRLRLEQLESRYLLAGDASPPDPITWFESYDDVPRISYESLSNVDPVYPLGFQGPRELANGEWIVQLEHSTARRIRVLESADNHLDDGFNDFTIIAGLGSEGLMLVRGEGVTSADIEASLSGNESVESFSRNSVITGQEITINDFSPSLMQGLDTINVQAAWEQNTGDMNTIVGVVDSGIDLDHPDLYLNIWINQGEIPAEIREGDPDVNGDEL